MAGKFEEVSKLLPTNIKQALDSPTVNDLVHAIGKVNVCFAVEYELCKMADMINVGGNLTGAQAQFIATQLVEMFPAENLADFKICFQRGAMGQYGDIFRMDGVVIRKWMEQYLDEKYQTVEEKLMKEKDNMYKAPEKTQAPPFNIYEEFLKIHGKVTDKIPAMTREQILEQGQSEPPRKPSTGHRPMTPEEVEEWHRQKAAALEDAKARRIAELREKHPTLTAEELNRLL